MMESERGVQSLYETPTGTGTRVHTRAVSGSPSTATIGAGFNIHTSTFRSNGSVPCAANTVFTCTTGGKNAPSSLIRAKEVDTMFTLGGEPGQQTAAAPPLFRMQMSSVPPEENQTLQGSQILSHCAETREQMHASSEVSKARQDSSVRTSSRKTRKRTAYDHPESKLGNEETTNDLMLAAQISYGAGRGEYVDDNEEGMGGKWTIEEDRALIKGVEKMGAKYWKYISQEYLHNRRTDVQCLHRWQKVLKPGLKKGPWLPSEDKIIQECVAQGITKWSEIAARIPGRIGKQCRERWFNHLSPDISKEPWTEEEDRRLVQLREMLGNRWCAIAKQLPGRTENAVKNRWNSAKRRQANELKEASKSIGDGNNSGTIKRRKTASASVDQSSGSRSDSPAKSRKVTDNDYSAIYRTDAEELTFPTSDEPQQLDDWEKQDEYFVPGSGALMSFPHFESEM